MEQNWITSDDILGKDVIDTDGTFLGVIDKLFISPETINVVAFSVDKGFLEKGLVISKEYIERVSKYAVFLNITPVFLLVNKSVFAQGGKKVGVVQKIVQDEKNKNAIVSISVKTSSGLKEYTVSEIAEIGKNVVLK